MTDAKRLRAKRSSTWSSTGPFSQADAFERREPALERFPEVHDGRRRSDRGDGAESPTPTISSRARLDPPVFFSKITGDVPNQALEMNCAVWKRAARSPRGAARRTCRKPNPKMRALPHQAPEKPLRAWRARWMRLSNFPRFWMIPEVTFRALFICSKARPRRRLRPFRSPSESRNQGKKTWTHPYFYGNPLHAMQDFASKRPGGSTP